MAAKKRRSRSLKGLAGSPEHHRAEANLNAKNAIRQYKGAKEYAKHGQCDVAFSQFALASVSEGKAIAHDREAYGPMSVSERGALSDAYYAAEKAFASTCLGSHKVSGLKARRRRK